MRTIARYLRSDFTSLSDEERRSLLYELDLTSQRTIDLLDNLLQWAKCQTGDIQFQPDTYHLHLLLVECTVQSRKSSPFPDNPIFLDKISTLRLP